MKKSFFYVVLTIFLIFCQLSAAAEDQRILEIRRIYSEVTERETLEAGGDVVGGNTHSVTYNISAVRFHAEYLFSTEGELLFHYMKDEGFTGGERRFYFYKGQLIRVKINPTIESDSGPLARYQASQSFSKRALELAEEIKKKAISHREFFRLLLQFQHIE